MLLLESKSKFRHGNKTSSRSPKEYHLLLEVEDMPIPIKIFEMIHHINQKQLIWVYDFTLSKTWSLVSSASIDHRNRGSALH